MADKYIAITKHPVPGICMTGMEHMTVDYVEFWASMDGSVVRYFGITGHVIEILPENGKERYFTSISKIPQSDGVLRSMAEYLRQVWELHH